MLIILTVSLVIASILLLWLRKSKESILLLGLCGSLMLEICGVMIFIAKKGGVSPEVVRFLYFSQTVQMQIRYYLITLRQMGYMIAVGRTLFPLFLLEIALNYSMIPFVRKNKILQGIAAGIPMVTLVCYLPSVYNWLVRWNANIQNIMANACLLWISLYLVLSCMLLLCEFFSITMKLCRRQFSQIMIFLLAITCIYGLYYRQDPGQVYRFYSYSSAWNKGIGYMQVSPSVFSYSLLVLVNIIGAIIGFYSLFRFTRGNFEADIEDVVMERKFDTAKIGASMFVHSMKNQLLSSRIIFKRIDQLYEQPELDTVRLKEYIDSLEEFNEAMMKRMEELYRCVKSNAIYMVPLEIEEVFQYSVERFHTKYPNEQIEIKNHGVTMILADKIHFCEALYNLLINAQEAVQTAERGESGKVSIICHNERLYTVIEVRDNGRGMTKQQVKKIFEPFYSSKNSNYNWGMGLYYVQEIVKSHLGSIRVESKEGVGSSFLIMLPKYQ